MADPTQTPDQQGAGVVTGPIDNPDAPSSGYIPRSVIESLRQATEGADSLIQRLQAPAQPNFLQGLGAILAAPQAGAAGHANPIMEQMETERARRLQEATQAQGIKQAQYADALKRNEAALKITEGLLDSTEDPKLRIQFAKSRAKLLREAGIAVPEAMENSWANKGMSAPVMKDFARDVDSGLYSPEELQRRYRSKGLRDTDQEEMIKALQNPDTRSFYGLKTKEANQRDHYDTQIKKGQAFDQLFPEIDRKHPAGAYAASEFTRLRGKPLIEADPDNPEDLAAIRSSIEVGRRRAQDDEIEKKKATQHERALEPLLVSARDWVNSRGENPNPMESPDSATRKGFRPQYKPEKSGGGAADRPIGGNASKYAHRDTLETPQDTDMSDAEAGRAGFVKVTPKQRDALAQLQKTETIIVELGQLATQIITAPDALRAAGQLATLTAGAIAGTNTVARMYRDTRESLLSVLARTIAAERGTLTDKDIARANGMLPNFGDTAAVREAKLRVLNMALDTAKEAERAAITGKPFDRAAMTKRTDDMVRDLSGKKPPAAGGNPLNRRIRRQGDTSGQSYGLQPGYDVPAGYELIK